MSSLPTPRKPDDWLKHNWLELILLLLTASALLWIASTGRAIWEKIAPAPPPVAHNFDGEFAYDTLRILAGFGPRMGDSAGHAAAARLIKETLTQNGWQIETQPFQIDQGGPVYENIIAKAGNGPVVVLAVHYDSASLGGANDGASAVAVLLELARSLDKTRLPGQVWLVFADGQYSPQGVAVARGMDMALSAYAMLPPEERANIPWSVILFDLVGNTEAPLYVDTFLNKTIRDPLWDVVRRLKYEDWFVRRSVGDFDLGQDALATLRETVIVLAGVDYAQRGSSQDISEQLDAASLQRVGDVLEVYLYTLADPQ